MATLEVFTSLLLDQKFSQHTNAPLFNPVPGDSGAWVFDQSGQVCGHVLAWSEKSRTAYIAPMEILLDDIARTLGARSVTLPGSEEEVAWRRAMAAAATIANTKHGLSMVKDQLPLELGKLSIDRLDESSSPLVRPGASTAGVNVPGGNKNTMANATTNAGATTTAAMKDVPVSRPATYSRNVNALMSHPRAVEHQFA